MMRRKARGHRVVGDVAQANGSGVIDEQAQHTLALGQMSDLPNGFVIKAFVDELDHSLGLVVHAEGSVPCVDETGGHVHDRAQGFFEFQAGADGQHRLDETVEAIASFDDLFDAILYLDQ
jgi:hypothetical protein